MSSGNVQHDLFIDAPIWHEGLCRRQRLFVEYYCTDRTCFLNATSAYIKAYSNPKKPLADSSIQSNAARLMRNPLIKPAINKLLRAQQNEEDHLNEYRVLKLIDLLAHYNPADFYDERGELKQLSELGDLALCISEIKRNKYGRLEYKFYDRTKALAMSAQYLNIIRPAEGAAAINPVVYLSGKDLSRLEAEAAEAAPTAEEAQYEVMNDDD